MKLPAARTSIALALVILSLTFSTVFLLRECARLPGRMITATAAAARDAVHIFRDTLQVQPKVRIGQEVVYEQIAPVAELAVVTRDQITRLTYSHELTLLDHAIPATEKHVTIEAVYRIKAGFDLRQPFTVDIDAATGRIVAELPPARILSVEPVGTTRYEGADGWLNRLTDGERQQVLNDLQMRTRTAAESSDLCLEAERQAHERLVELFRRNGQEVVFRARHAPVLPAP